VYLKKTKNFGSEEMLRRKTYCLFRIGEKITKKTLETHEESDFPRIF